MDKGGYVVLDIDNLTQPPEKCYAGSPKMTVCPTIFNFVLLCCIYKYHGICIYKIVARFVSFINLR